MCQKCPLSLPLFRFLSSYKYADPSGNGHFCIIKGGKRFVIHTVHDATVVGINARECTPPCSSPQPGCGLAAQIRMQPPSTPFKRQERPNQKSSPSQKTTERECHMRAVRCKFQFRHGTLVPCRACKYPYGGLPLAEDLHTMPAQLRCRIVSTQSGRGLHPALHKPCRKARHLSLTGIPAQVPVRHPVGALAMRASLLVLGIISGVINMPAIRSAQTL